MMFDQIILKNIVFNKNDPSQMLRAWWEYCDNNEKLNCYQYEDNFSKTNFGFFFSIELKENIWKNQM